jgi:hypothetical protein
LGLGDFVLVRLEDLELYLMWMEKVENEVVKDKHYEFFFKLHIQWWVPVKKRARNDKELYQDCWVSKWKCHLAYLKQWLTCHLFYSHFLLKVMSQSIAL